MILCVSFIQLLILFKKFTTCMSSTINNVLSPWSRSKIRMTENNYNTSDFKYLMVIPDEEYLIHTVFKERLLQY